MSDDLTFRSTGLSHVGHVREHNEDAWLARSEIGLWAVADGLGGHARGEVASAAIVAALSRLPAPVDAPGHLRAVEAALAAAHAEIQALGEATSDLCASTVAALVAFDRHFAVLWCGDSRVYRLRAGTLERLTRDHSLVQELVDGGSLSPADAEGHPMRNRITRAVGLPGPLELDRAQGELAAGDLFLLCTDGLTGLVDEATTQRLLSADCDDLGATTLVQSALGAGGTDNVTVILVKAEDREKTWPGAGR
ncbi:MAG: PP2C family serine/threonine-protein phosphatase [Geminicoccaceae bacterium]